MAGAGYKLFSTGDVLSASDVNTYLMQQTVMSFANAAARTSALSAVLAEGLVSYLQDTNVVEIYTGAAWVSLDDPNAIQNTLLTTTGDTIYASSANTPARRAIGTTGQVLTVSGGVPVWATPAGGGGKVLQVVQNTSTTLVTTTSKAVWIQQAITPSATTSKILITVCGNLAYTANTNAFGSGDIRDVTNSANLVLWDVGVASSTSVASVFSQTFLHSPATASSITYALRMGTGSGGTTSVNSASNAYSIILMEIGA